MKNVKYLIPIALATSAVGGAVALADADTTRQALPTKAEVLHLFDRWNAALKSGDANRVARPPRLLRPTRAPLQTHGGSDHSARPLRVAADRDRTRATGA